MLGNRRKSRKEEPYIKTLDRLKSDQLASHLIQNIKRVMPPDIRYFEKILATAGPIEATQAIKYLPFNRQVVEESDTRKTLSLVAVFNNRRMEKYRLKGLKKQISGYLFSRTKNHMDHFINRIRSNGTLVNLMSRAEGTFSILGIFQKDEIEKKRFFKKQFRSIAPLILVNCSEKMDVDHINDFENRHTIKKVKRFGLPMYKKIK